MLTLGLHTTAAACGVAIVRDGELLTEQLEAMLRGQDARLPGLVSDACRDAGVKLGDFDRFGVVTGPGSFTGVRVGVAFARGLSLATGAPCIGVTTLEAALPAGQQGSAIVLFPAQKREPNVTFWTQLFRSGDATGPAREMTLEAVISLLAARPHMVYGDGGALQAALPDLDVRGAIASAARVAVFAADADPDRHPPRPTYARAPDALLPGGLKPS